MSEDAPKRFPWRTLLFVSAAVNLLLIGGGIGAYGAGARFQRPADGGAAMERTAGARGFLAALPPEARAQVRRDMVRGVAQSRELRQAAAEARREALTVAAEESYDVERVRAAFARMRAADQAVVGVFHDRVAESFGAMTTEERRAALDSLRRPPPRRRPEVNGERRWRDRPAP